MIDSRTCVRHAAALLIASCVWHGSMSSAAAALRFPQDVFAFANETVWEYHDDPASGRQWWSKRDPRPPFSLRCGPMARAVRQFFTNARFDPAAPRTDAATYERLVVTVMQSDPRRPRTEPIVIPGYPDLRSFSEAHAALIQAHVSGAWTSQLQRGNWRMIFPFTPAHQAATMRKLAREIAAGKAPIVHVLRFPNITMNHMVVVYAAEETPAEVRFLAWDPNNADAPVTLTFDRVARRFSFPRTLYFPGGPVRVYEIYDGWLY